MSNTSDVLIIGAGLSGLSAAIALSSAGASVSLLERKPYIGGRAYSYPHPALNEVIDSQHVMLGCCTNLIDICKLSGADQHIRWYNNITFLEPSKSTTNPGAPFIRGASPADERGEGASPTTTARASTIGPSFLPAPFHSSWSFLTAPMLSLADKTRIALGLLDFFRGYPATDEEPFSAWLTRTKQTQRAILHFWEPIIVGALNDTFDRCSTRYAGQVFYESFLKSPQGGRLGIPALPMTEFYQPLATLAQKQGTRLHLRTSVTSITKTEEGNWQATASDGTLHSAPQLLLALPFEQTSTLLKTIANGHLKDTKNVVTAHANAPQIDANFIHAPITTLHLWFDREITPLHHAALLDTRIQWVFNKSKIRPNEPGHYLELVISASFAELHQTRETLLESALSELASFFPEVRNATLLKSGILKEARATFSVTPNLDRHRPVAAQGNNLFLAGDYTRTGWPSTMESAVRSGRLAAEAITAAAGNPLKFLTPDLPASGFMRLFQP